MPNTDDMKGRAKEAAGDLTNDDDLKSEGKTDQASGKVKETIDDAKKKLEGAVDNIKDRLNKN